MAMMQVDQGCSTDIKKLYTSYTWSLNHWTLLYDDHYSVNVIISPEFLINGTEGCTCRLTLVPSQVHNGYYCARVRIKFSNDLDCLLMGTSICFLDKWMKPIVQKYSSTHPKPVAKQNTDVFVRIDLRKEECQKCLTNDTLTLFVELTIVKSISTTPLPVKTHIENFSTSWCKNLRVLQDSKSLCDVTFVIGDKKLFAHKVILAINSEIFKAMFTSGMQEERESTVDIVDTDAEVYEEFINYIYSRNVRNLDSMVDELIIVADKYQVHDLIALCENVITLRINTENVIQYLIMADKLCLANLKNKAITFVKANVQIFKDSAKYKMLLDYPALMEKVFSV